MSFLSRNRLEIERTPRRRSDGPEGAKIPTPSQIRHRLRVTDATSRYPGRDTLVLLLGFTCGMRVSEIAQVEVSDVLLPSGRLREEVRLRGAITKGSKARSSI